MNIDCEKAHSLNLLPDLLVRCFVHTLTVAPDSLAARLALLSPSNVTAPTGGPPLEGISLKHF